VVSKKISQNPEAQALMEKISAQGSQKAADGISWLLGEKLDVTHPAFETLDFSELMEDFGGPGTEIVGIYIESQDDIPIHVMLIMPLPEAFLLTAGLLGEDPEEVQEIDDLGSSALAEMANVTGTQFFNTIAEITGKTLRPSTPAVMIDMLGSILNIIIAKTGCISGEVLTFETAFVRQDQDLKINFRAISSPDALEALMREDD
jgi:chemotaxis protein CheC